jgi:hypothetical protein
MKGNIYKLISPSHPELVYYGSTKSPLYVRRGSHKGDYKKKKNSTACLILCYDDWSMELVEEYEYETPQQLRDREKWYIQNNTCVNHRMKYEWDSKTYNTKYYEEKKEERIKASKEYYEANKEKISEKRKDMSQEERDAYNKKNRERQVKLRKNMTQEEKDEFNRKKRERRHKLEEKRKDT